MFDKTRLLDYMDSLIIPAIWETVKIIFFSSVFSIILGFIFGILLFVTDKNSLIPNRLINWIIDKTTNLIRAFPTLILIVSLAPVTRRFVGTTIGSKAAIFAITIACTPFAVRMTQNALKEVDVDLIKAAKSFGASKVQIVQKVIIVEAVPALISNFTIMLINMLNMTAMAGAVGAGGLGAVALTYGYQQFDNAIMYFIIAILIIMVLLIEKASS